MARGKRSKRASGATPRPANRKPVPKPPPDERPGLSPRVLLAGLVGLLLVGLILFLVIGTGDEPADEQAAAAEELAVPWVDPDGPSPIVGSVDVNPADDSVWLSTNTGLFRVPEGADEPERVTGRLTTDDAEGDISEQLVVRFRGPDELIGSGHPPEGESLPSSLGMIASDDAGATWSSLGELGTADFHAIQTAGDVIVAGRFGEPAVSVSDDGGRTFDTLTPPSAIVDLEVDPGDPDRWIASTADELLLTEDRGGSWRPLEPVPNIRFAWPASDALYRIDPGGPVKFSADAGRTWQDRGTTGGEPQAMFAAGPRRLYVALRDGTVKESRDGGETWADRVAGAP